MGEVRDEGDALLLAGLERVRSGSRSEARPLVLRAVELQPAWGPYQLVLSVLCQLDGERHRAAELRERAARLMPDAARHQLLSCVGAWRGRWRREDLAALCLAARRVAPEAEVLCDVARVLNAGDELEEAEVMLRQSLALDPLQWHTLEALVENLNGQGRHGAAMRALATLTRFQPRTRRYLPSWALSLRPRRETLRRVKRVVVVEAVLFAAGFLIHPLLLGVAALGLAVGAVYVTWRSGPSTVFADPELEQLLERVEDERRLRYAGVLSEDA